MALVEKRVRFWPPTLQAQLNELQDDARLAICQALQDAKWGLTSPAAKPHGEDKRLSGVTKVVKDAPDGNTYRGIYTVEFPEAVWVIDVYEKKSTKGIKTPQATIERTVARLKALRNYRSNTPEGKALVVALLKDLADREEAARKIAEGHDGGTARPAKGR